MVMIFEHVLSLWYLGAKSLRNCYRKDEGCERWIAVCKKWCIAICGWPLRPPHVQLYICPKSFTLTNYLLFVFLLANSHRHVLRATLFLTITCLIAARLLSVLCPCCSPSDQAGFNQSSSLCGLPGALVITQGFQLWTLTLLHSRDKEQWCTDSSACPTQN